MRIFYVFCRMVDDIADSDRLIDREKRRYSLQTWREALLSIPRRLQQLPGRFAETDSGLHALDTHYFLELIKGVRI